MDYGRSLPFPITPKNGPIPALLTLRDASRAITAYLPRDRVREPHWLRAGFAVRDAARASERSPALLRAAAEALAEALDAEGWMSRRDLARIRDHGRMKKTAI
jgi:hypothetical protein